MKHTTKPTSAVLTEQARRITKVWRTEQVEGLRRELKALAREQQRPDLVMTIDTYNLSRSVTELESVLRALGLRLALEPVELH